MYHTKAAKRPPLSFKGVFQINKKIIVMVSLLVFSLFCFGTGVKAVSYTDQITSWTLETNDSHSYYDHYVSNYVPISSFYTTYKVPADFISGDYDIRLEFYHQMNGIYSLVTYVDQDSSLIGPSQYVTYNGTGIYYNNVRLVVMKNGNVSSPVTSWNASGLLSTNSAFYNDISLIIQNTYTLGFADGVLSVDTTPYYDEGYDDGYDVGYTDGYNVGLTNEVVPKTLFESVIGFISGIFTLEILPGMTIAGISGIVIGFFFLTWFLKQIRG